MTAGLIETPRLPGLALALALSAAVHGGLALWWFAGQSDEILLEGGGASQAVTLGDAFDDMLVEGTVAPEIQPETVSEDAQEPVSPLEPRQSSEVITPAEPAQLMAKAVDTSVEGSFVETATPRELPLEPLAAIQPQKIEPAVQKPVESVQPETNKPVETPLEQPVEAVPLPLARPEPPTEVQKPIKRTETAKTEPRERKERPVKSGTKAGAGGRSNANAQKGGAQTKGAGTEGNAAVSNYPGKVARALRRALRYPSAAKRRRITGDVHVSFVVSQSGGLSGVSIVRSSGSDILDAAALETVRRAAPFPPIPPEAGRSSWPFRLPISFN